MDRRKFFSSMGAVAAAATVAPMAIADTPTHHPDLVPMTPEHASQTLAVLLKTSAGRQKLAASLGSSIRRRLDIRREAMGLPKCTPLDENFPKDAEISPYYPVFDAPLHIEELRLKRYHKLAAGLRVAMDSLIFEEARRYQFRKPTRELFTLPTTLMSFDDPGNCIVSFRLIQKYAEREV